MIAVLGGGISGLALGWELSRRGMPFRILEASDTPGGVVRSAEVEGHVLDWGPQRIRLTERLSAVIRDIGLEDDVVLASGDSTLWVYHSGRLRRIPFSARELVTTDALTLPGKLRLLAEPFLPGPSPDESVASFLRRKLGREVYDHIAGPLYGGLYSSDPEDMVMRLSLGHVLREFGVGRSMLLRLLGTGGRIPRPPAVSFTDGMAMLPAALAEKLGPRLELGTPARWIRQDGDGWEVGIAGGSVRADEVVVCTPAPVAARLLREVDPEAAGRVARLRYNPIAVVHVESDARLEGLGFKVSFRERTPLRGVTYNHSLFGRTGLYTVYLGGASHPGAVELDDEALADLGAEEFQRTVGHRARPISVGREAMPAWDATWSAMEGMVLPDGLHLMGNWTGRPGIPGRFAVASLTAAKLAERVRLPSEAAGRRRRAPRPAGHR